MASKEVKTKEEKITEMSTYNFTKEFKTDCLPHIIKLKQFCITHGVPFFMTFAVKNDKNGTEYTTVKQLPIECGNGIELTDDLIRRTILAVRGFDIVINNQDSFDMDDLAALDFGEDE